ncbi:phage holin family protein [Pseudoflavitalea sp. X16]|uniref:phage holin family protein n=1 Tax=Paraflavitalea devenefica TaxID=2716334 RepID=UPI00142475BE|nr:phage holin family protein [Paraflavitalea devenefica]NII27822.1 phage holin family protein [Paraflavitalea devenefica]
MEGSTTGIRGLAASVKEYVNTRVDSVKLSAAETTSLIISDLVAGAIVAVVFLFVLVFASIAGALALSAWIGKPWSGFLIVAGVYLLIGVITWTAKERMIRIPVMNKIIHQLFKNDAGDEED